MGPAFFKCFLFSTLGPEKVPNFYFKIWVGTVNVRCWPSHFVRWCSGPSRRFKRLCELFQSVLLSSSRGPPTARRISSDLASNSSSSSYNSIDRLSPTPSNDDVRSSHHIRLLFVEFDCLYLEIFIDRIAREIICVIAFVCVSVRLSVGALLFEPFDLWPWFLAWGST